MKWDDSPTWLRELDEISCQTQGSYLLKCCLPMVPMVPSTPLVSIMSKDYLQNVLFSQTLSMISHREATNVIFLLSLLLIHLCLCFACVSWHTGLTSLSPEVVIACRISGGNCRVSFLLLAPIVNIQMLDTHLFIIRTPDSVRESMSAGPLCSPRSSQVA